MKLKDFLMVCGDTDMTITDTQDKTLCSGYSSHKELANYENWDIVDITTNGYEKIFVVIEQSKESKDSSKGIMEMCAELIAEKDKRILLLEEDLKRYQAAARDHSTYIVKGGINCGKSEALKLSIEEIQNKKAIEELMFFKEIIDGVKNPRNYFLNAYELIEFINVRINKLKAPNLMPLK